MKKSLLLVLCGLMLVSCNPKAKSSSSISSSNSIIEPSINSTLSSSSVSSSELESTSSTVSSSDSFSSSITSSEGVSSSIETSSTISSSISETISSSSNEVISSISSSIPDPTGTNPDGGGKRMPLPLNRDNKIELGHDNSTMSTFEFNNEMPEYFRAISGNNFYNGSYYSNGELKISSSTNAKQGFQTGMFISNLKLEIRINIGQMNNSSSGNKIDKDSPVLSIYGFDDLGNFVRASYIDTITMNNANNYVRVYMDGTDVSYLEVRAMQLPYKGSQAYNMGLRGISLIAWPYPL